MARYRIDPERSRIDVTARPSLPGVRLVVGEVSGTVDAAGGAATGQLTVSVRAVIDDPDRAPGTPDWLRPGDPVAGAGQLDAVVRDDGREGVDLRVRLALGDRQVPLTGEGRIERRREEDDDVIDAVGVTIVDPRTLGFALPPLVTYTLQTRWRLRLVRID